MPDANATHIGVNRRVDTGRDQEALLHEFAHLRALDHGLEDGAEAAAVATARCGSEAEQDRVWG